MRHSISSIWLRTEVLGVCDSATTSVSGTDIGCLGVFNSHSGKTMTMPVSISRICRQALQPRVKTYVVGGLAIGIRILRRVLEVRLLDPPSGAFRLVQVLYEYL
jgi:hypothetical protein